MKKVISLLGICALSAFGDIPKTAEDWYAPPEGWNPMTSEAKWTKSEKIDGEWVNVEYYVKINESGEIVTEYPKGVSEAEKQALETAVSALHATKWNDKKIETLGEKLHEVFSIGGITVTGKTPD